MCRTGLGRARQDVNVSIDGGTRLKSRGWQLETSQSLFITRLCQKALIELKDTAISRGIDDSSFGWSGDVTELVKQQACFGFVWGQERCPSDIAKKLPRNSCHPNRSWSCLCARAFRSDTGGGMSGHSTQLGLL